MDAYSEGNRNGRKMYAPNFTIRNARGTLLRTMTAIERTQYMNGYEAGKRNVSPATFNDWLKVFD